MTLTADEGWKGASVVAVPGRFDLQYLGTQIAQELGDEGTGQHARQVKHLEAGQWSGPGLRRPTAAAGRAGGVATGRAIHATGSSTSA